MPSSAVRLARGLLTHIASFEGKVAAKPTVVCHPHSTIIQIPIVHKSGEPLRIRARTMNGFVGGACRLPVTHKLPGIDMNVRSSAHIFAGIRHTIEHIQIEVPQRKSANVVNEIVYELTSRT